SRRLDGLDLLVLCGSSPPPTPGGEGGPVAAGLKKLGGSDAGGASEISGRAGEIGGSASKIDSGAGKIGSGALTKSRTAGTPDRGESKSRQAAGLVGSFQPP
ncbi:unnamed protein product, partial [Urochloa humidicola]